MTTVQFINSLSSSTEVESGHSHSHGPGEHGHTHEHLEHAGAHCPTSLSKKYLK